MKDQDTELTGSTDVRGRYWPEPSERENAMKNTIKPGKISKGWKLVRRNPWVPGETLTVISGRGPVTRLIKWEAEVSPFTEIGSEYLHNIATAISPDSGEEFTIEFSKKHLQNQARIKAAGF